MSGLFELLVLYFNKKKWKVLPTLLVVTALFLLFQLYLTARDIQGPNPSPTVQINEQMWNRIPSPIPSPAQAPIQQSYESNDPVANTESVRNMTRFTELLEEKLGPSGKHLAVRIEENLRNERTTSEELDETIEDEFPQSTPEQRAKIREKVSEALKIISEEKGI